MGHFYVNMTVRTEKANDIVNLLRRRGREAYVTLPQQGFVVVFENESNSQDCNVIQDVGAEISQAVGAPLLAVMNHDDDVLCYWLFDKGDLVDGYNSNPNYFDQPSEFPEVFDEEADAANNRGGDVALLCQTLGKPPAKGQVQRILHDKDYVFAFERHSELCKALDLPESAVGNSYESILNDQLPAGITAMQILLA